MATLSLHRITLYLSPPHPSLTLSPFLSLISSLPVHEGADYLSTINRENLNKSPPNGPVSSAPTKSAVPAFAKLTLKPVPAGFKKDGVTPASPIAPTRDLPVSAPANVAVVAPVVAAPVISNGTYGTPSEAKAAAARPAVGTSETTFPYDLLKSAPPDGIDLKNKEAYLSASMFLSVFGMDEKSYDLLPKWKKDLIKKKVGLF